MGSFQFNGAISGSILNNPLGDARFYEHNGQITLASDGGQGVVTLTTGANQAATLAHSVPMSATAPSQNVALGGRVISISDQDLTAVLNSRSDSSLTLHSGNSGRYSDRLRRYICRPAERALWCSQTRPAMDWPPFKSPATGRWWSKTKWPASRPHSPIKFPR